MRGEQQLCAVFPPAAHQAPPRQQPQQAEKMNPSNCEHPHHLFHAAGIAICCYVLLAEMIGCNAAVPHTLITGVRVVARKWYEALLAVQSPHHTAKPNRHVMFRLFTCTWKIARG
jgi:hypothetical protein